MAKTANFNWRFFRAGGFDQVRIDSSDELLAIKNLDQKLWVALACPTKGIEFDERTLSLIDTDQDGSLRAPELIAAIDWAAARLADTSVLAKDLPGLPLTAIRTDTDEGKVLEGTAQSLLAALGKMGESVITVEDASSGEAQFKTLPNNGDGVIDANDCGNEELAAALNDIVATLGGVADQRGGTGLDRATLERFFNTARALVEWHKANVTEASAIAHAAVAAIADKVDDFFVRSRLAAFDERAVDAVNSSNEQLALIGAQSLNEENAGIASLPLARISANGVLPLLDGVNPAWATRVAALRSHAIVPLLGARDVLTENDWYALKDKLAARTAWEASKPDHVLDSMPLARIEEILASNAEAQLTDLIAADEAHAPQAAAIASVERLARYVRDLLTLANNFVAFRNFYTRQGKATFQVGTLYLDSRSAELVIAVNDVARHAAMASLARLFIVYCDCARKDAAGVEHKTTIAAAFTAGDSDQLIVGRNGVFYDRKGNDWNATITKVADHPISLRQAFWSPYKRLVRMIGEQVQKLAASKAAAIETKIDVVAADAGKHVAAPPVAPAAPPTPFDVGKFAGIFAAIGLAVGAIGTALASMLSGLLGLAWWKIPLVFLGLILIISTPAVILAWFKLRTRTLGPLLDANGWAINARARINIPFGTSLTQLAKLPEGAQRSLKDPYAEKRTPWGLYLLLLAVIGGAIWWLYFR
ncbi:MAG TPA: hypothetical protein VL381_01925 [Rhodocyclaceae bacterium]|nr:hypothetical protein [Rhodocyclaceae bacterium]